MYKAVSLWTAMLSLAACCGCQTPRLQSSDVHPVWTQSAPPPATLPAPNGFAITPLEAYQEVALHGQVWHVYADESNYYLLHVTSDSNGILALKKGTRLSGDTGLILDKHGVPLYR